MRDPLTVCVATYNGQAHVREQLNSILDELEPFDHLIIVDDASTDGTPQVLKDFANRPNTEVIRLDQNGGHVRAFAIALDRVATGLVVLSDQDDLWPSGRIGRLLSVLGESHVLATGSFETFGNEAVAHRLTARDRGAARNLLNMFSGGLWGDVPYWGSCMIFRRSLLNYALPLPSAVEAHDQWLGVLANLLGTTAHTNEVVTLRRLHAGNLSPQKHRPILRALLGKFQLLHKVLVATWRIRRRDC